MIIIIERILKLAYPQFILCLFLTLCNQLQAQSFVNDYKFDHLTVNDGLSHSDAMFLVQDNMGFIWVGTNKGVDRFDGIEFKNYSFKVDDKSSLSGNRIRTIYYSKQNELWVGTENFGLNLYDVNSDSFIRINEDVFPAAYSSLAEMFGKTYITSIAQDKFNQVWVGTMENGVFVLKRDSNGNFISIKNLLKKADINTSKVNTIIVDSNETIWIGTGGKGLMRAVSEELTEGNINNSLYKSSFLATNIQALHIDKVGNLWIGADNKVFYLDQVHINTSNMKDAYRLHPEVDFKDITALCLDSNNKLWVGTWYGIYLIETDAEPNKFPVTASRIQQILPKDGQTSNINSSRIHQIIEDHSKTIWIATSAGGVNKTDLLSKPFHHIKRNILNSNSIASNYINAIYLEEKNNILWIGTRNGFSKFNLDTKKCTNYLNKELGGDGTGIDISAIMKDTSGNLWLGTWNNGFYIFKKNSFDEKIIKYNITTEDDNSLNNSVLAFCEDKYGYIWVASLELGLLKYTKKGVLVKTYFQETINLPSYSYLSLYYNPKTSFLWVGTKNGGLLKMHITKEDLFFLKQYHHDKNNNNSLRTNYVWPILKGDNNKLWIGTLGGGLNEITKNKAGIEVLVPHQEWLPDSDVESILQDEEGNLWMGGDGLTKYNPLSKKYIKFDVEDGLQSNSFKVGAAWKSMDGTMFFGGINGINYFNPKEIKSNPYPPKVLITKLRILNKPVSIGETLNGRTLLKKNILLTDEITIKNNENDFSLDFVSIPYSNPKKHVFAYKLDGYLKDWVYLEKGQRTASFSNLDDGEYTLFIKASNGEDIWSKVPTSIKIRILPPWYKTWWAYLVYFVLSVLTLWLTSRFIISRQNLKNSLAIEKIQHEKDQELNEMKINFFTNVSHELRTPLTLIIGPLEELISGATEPKKIKDSIIFVHEQTKKLLNLVNQLLDFRSAKLQKSPLIYEKQNIVAFVNEIFLMFKHKAREKNIEYIFNTNNKNIDIYFDPEKMETVITNLIANAFKYTPNNKKIIVNIVLNSKVETTKQLEQNSFNDNYVTISVKDFGVGMESESLKHIFNVYYQATKANAIKSIGNGIGLSLVKEILDRHGGTIDVESEVGKGTEFIVALPIKINPYDSNFVISKENLNENLSEEIQEIIISEDNEKNISTSKILIVEDNPDILQYLYNLFTKNMDVYTASSGEEGWNIINDVMPDLILSDIMMEGIDGLELCKKTKENVKTMHIPFVLLTAKAATVHKLEGYDLGADDYIIKPFIPKLLLAKVNTIITNRRNLNNFYKRQILLESTEIEIPDENYAFLEKSIRIVENNLQDPNFNVEFFVEQIGMSHSVVYRKIKSITGQSLVHFIRDVRLKRAAQLLQETDLRISEIANYIGIEDPKYFGKVFTKMFKMSPSQYAKKNKTNS